MFIVALLFLSVSTAAVILAYRYGRQDGYYLCLIDSIEDSKQEETLSE